MNCWILPATPRQLTAALTTSACSTKLWNSRPCHVEQSVTDHVLYEPEYILHMLWARGYVIAAQ
jgi:hypothetical protein